MNDTGNSHGFTYYGKTPSGVEMALSLEIPPEWGPEEIGDFIVKMDAVLAAKKCTRSDRLDKPAYGGQRPGNQRPETPPPAGIVRWEHCGVPARYIVYKKDGAKGAPARGVPEGKADMWVCAKDKQCEDVTSGRSERAAAYFDMRIAIETAPSRAQNGAEPAKPHLADGDRPMTAQEKQQFWQATRDMGYGREQVFAWAADVLMGQGPAMKDTEFAALMEASKISVHRVFVALKEKHEAAAKKVTA